MATWYTNDMKTTKPITREQAIEYIRVQSAFHDWERNNPRHRIEYVAFSSLKDWMRKGKQMKLLLTFKAKD